MDWSFCPGRSLKAQIQKQSVDVGRRIESLVDQTPPAKQFEQAGVAMNRLTEQVGQVEQLAKQDSQRLLLSYKIFPKPKETSQQIYSEFGEAFRQGLEGLIRDVRGLDAPSESDLSKELGPDSARNIRVVAGGVRDKTTQNLIDAICARRAGELGVYANPKLFGWYGYWEQIQIRRRRSGDPGLLEQPGGLLGLRGHLCDDQGPERNQRQRVVLAGQTAWWESSFPARSITRRPARRFRGTALPDLRVTGMNRFM